MFKEFDTNIPSYMLDDGISLIIGVTPGENRHNREFFMHPNVILLDNSDRESDIIIPSDFDKKRYVHINFLDLEELQLFADTNEKKFQTICFDWSTWKFFINEYCPIIDKDIARLNCLYKLLADGGTLVVQNPFKVSTIIFPREFRLETATRREYEKIKFEAENNYSEKIKELFIKSNFINKYFCTYNEVNNELFIKGPLSHPSNIEQNTWINNVLICLK